MSASLRGGNDRFIRWYRRGGVRGRLTAGSRAGRISCGLAVLLVWVGTGLARGAAPPPARSIEARGTTGAHAFAPGKWSVVGTCATNATDQPARLRSSTYFTSAPYLQFGRELWLPARARRWSECPVRVPDQVAERINELRTVAEDRSGPKPQRLLARDGALWATSQVPVDRSRAITAALTAGPGVPVDNEVWQVVLALGGVRNLKQTLSLFYGDSLPAMAEGWDALEQVIVSGDRLAQDAAGRAALREWLRNGGRLWIMLDRVQPETVQLLFGDLFGYHVVDRVGLTRLAIDRVSGAGARVPVVAPREFDVPVEFVRALVSDVEVVHTVNGWPASFRRPVGRGQVLGTTLGARGWMQFRSGRSRAPPGSEQSEYVATEALQALAIGFLAAPEPPAVPPEKVVPLLSDQVGYRVLGRGAVGGLLAGFCLAVGGLGLWLARRQRLERLGWIGPAAAVIAAVLIVALGRHARRSVPPTVAVFQRVTVDAGSEELDVHGLLALYRPEPGPLVPDTLQGGGLWPDMADGAGLIRRAVWTDIDAWHWEEFALPAGVRIAQCRQTVPLAAPLAARGAFGPGGFSGTLAGPFAGRSDAVLFGPAGTNLAVRMEDSGAFLAGPDDELARGQFIAAGLLSDEQRRRQGLYEQLLAPGVQSSPGPGESLWMALWSEPLPLGVPLPEAVRQTGAALVTVPVEIGRSPPGVRAVIPAPFIAYRAVQLEDRPHASAYSNAAREWITLQVPTETGLRFQLPRAVLPFTLEQATLTVNIDAPSRPVEVLGKSAAGSVPLCLWQGPHGRQRLVIDQPESLRVDAEGGIVLGLRVGAAPSAQTVPASAAPPGPSWTVVSVALEVAGMTAGQP